MNIQDIARLAGVSASTVSKVMNGKDRDISEETKKKVLKVIEEQHYVPYFKFREKEGLKNRLIGLIVRQENREREKEEMIRKVEEVCRLLNIEELMDKNPNELSGGQRQRVAFASIIVMDNDMLVIDEPTSQLDPHGTENVFEIIRKLKETGKTIILVEHKEEEEQKMAIELKNVSFAYPNGYVANENLNLTIEKGERIAIVGQNGAGKTTAVKLMNGLNRPTGGDVLVDGVNTKEKSCAWISRKVGYVFQNPDDQIFNSTALAEIQYMPKYFKLPESEIKKRTDRAVELTGIGKYLTMNPLDIPYAIRKFVAIAAIIATEPDYLILDEPTAGQDKRGNETLERIIEELGLSGNILFSSELTQAVR